MSTRPTVWNRVLAKMSGEVPADALEAYKRASLVVYEALERAQTHRRAAREDGRNAWSIRRAAQVEMLCAWNAFALQSLGDALLQSKYALDPLTVGFVPPVTAEQSLSFYSPIEGWLTRAGQAHLNPEYRIDVPIPAPLPPWSTGSTVPDTHLRGLLDAMRVLRDHTEADLSFLNLAPPVTTEQQRQLNFLRAQHSTVMLKARYADDMAGASASREVPAQIEQHVKEAIAGFFQLGQLLAIPALALGNPSGNTAQAPSQPTPARTPNPAPTPRPNPFPAPSTQPNPFPTPPPVVRPNPAPRPVPNPAPQTPPPAPSAPTWKFDIWCLTDPEARAKLERDPQARAAIEALWRADPDPDRTLSIQARIDKAREAGSIAFATDVWGTKLDYYFACPWPPAYTVRRALSVGGQKLDRGQRFIFNVSAQGTSAGAPFTREILVGEFSATENFVYNSQNPPRSR
jgi:hypothetical protein